MGAQLGVKMFHILLTNIYSDDSAAGEEIHRRCILVLAAGVSFIRAH